MRAATLVLFHVACYFAQAAALDPLQRRVASATNLYPGGSGYFAFYTDLTSGSLLCSSSVDGGSWSQGIVPYTGSYGVVSNPVVAYSNASVNVTIIQVFAQNSKGQLVCLTQTGPSTFQAAQITTTIPSTLTPDQFSQDSVQIITLNKMTHVFVRSQTAQPRLFYSYQSWGAAAWANWAAIGDDKTFLQYDAYIVINTFVNRIEAYATAQSGELIHTWQTSQTGFDGSWHKLGDFSSDKFSSSPVAHSIGPDFFNSVVRVFARGGDGALYTIAQTTCDKVQNPWGPCTWELWYSKVQGGTPSDPKVPNALRVADNVHLGLEVFVLGASNGHLYHLWQSDQGASWRGWDDIGPLSSASTFYSLPDLEIDPAGWWQAYALDSTGLVNRYVQTPLDFALSSGKLAYYDNETISWSIPVDQATHQDWIGVYPHGTPNADYVDFIYVGGTQNPFKDPVPKGQLTLMAVLPAGTYDYRYMVNKQYESVLEASAVVYNGSSDLEWVQLYKGLARGLGGLNTDIALCAKDGNTTLETFRAALTAFEDREIFTGLHLLGEALSDVKDTLIACNETVIVKDLEKFIEDLISCTEASCAKFLIDIGLEIVILYEDVYEIFGDIHAAHNSFGIEAYEQGGICIGRVTYACLSLPN